MKSSMRDPPAPYRSLLVLGPSTRVPESPVLEKPTSKPMMPCVVCPSSLATAVQVI
jgi:hypothetical protein